MAKFLKTKGIANELMELIEKAETQIFLISPYIQIPKTLYDRLKHRANEGIIINLVYGKTEMRQQELAQLKDLHCNIFYKDNLHAKCYASDNTAIISSLNLYSYSEINNEEMGVLLDRHKDKIAFDECSKEVQYLIKNSVEIRVSKRAESPAKTRQWSIEEFRKEWLMALRSNFPSSNFKQKDNYDYTENFVYKGVNFSTQYGFATIELDVSKEFGRNLKEMHYQNMMTELATYRVYWSSPFDKIFLYHEKGVEFDSLSQEIEYCLSGLSILLNSLSKIGHFRKLQ